MRAAFWRGVSEHLTARTALKQWRGRERPADYSQRPLFLPTNTAEEPKKGLSQPNFSLTMKDNPPIIFCSTTARRLHRIRRIRSTVVSS